MKLSISDIDAAASCPVGACDPSLAKQPANDMPSFRTVSRIDIYRIACKEANDEKTNFLRHLQNLNLVSQYTYSVFNTSTHASGLNFPPS
jgi:hypothetical protein